MKKMDRGKASAEGSEFHRVREVKQRRNSHACRRLYSCRHDRRTNSSSNYGCCPSVGEGSGNRKSSLKWRGSSRRSSLDANTTNEEANQKRNLSPPSTFHRSANSHSPAILLHS